MATQIVSQKSGMLPTPPLPADLPPVELTDNAFAWSGSNAAKQATEIKKEILRVVKYAIKFFMDDYSIVVEISARVHTSPGERRGQ